VGHRSEGEASLIARAKQGELHAYEEIVERHQATAFRVAWLITASSAEAEEAAQDAFLKAYRALGRFRDGASFRPWLLRIVANEARNRRVAASRRERLALRVHEERSLDEADASPETALLESAARAELISALQRLKERDRLAIACRYFLDLSEAETAAALGCRPGTVKSRLSRALARLKTELEDAGD
jgi:RNA polymerase sigma-70 factor (ECF subfamily)